MGLLNVAHRGYSAVAPENTLPALAAAVRAGASYVEFDVRTTADGVPVVIHDRTADRTTTGSGEVGALTLEQIRALDAGSWFSPAYAGVRVPRLAEVLDLLTAGAAPELLLEIKPPATAGQVRVIVELVAEYGLLDRTVVQSFDPDVVRLVAAAVPALRRGLLLSAFDADQTAVARELGLTFCNPSVAGVLTDPDMVARLAADGVGVLPWTPNDPATWPALAEAGVAGLITDRAGELAGWIRPR